MSWLQNIIVLIIGFLLSQILIAARTHVRLITYFLDHSRTTTGGLLTATLFLSYSLSIFFSNTVVVLALLPVVRKLMAIFGNVKNHKTLAALFYCALIFGANTGGMASLTGSPLNVAAVSFANFQALPGAEHVTFFSWLMVGVPASFMLILAGRWLILAHTPSDLEPSVLPTPHRMGSLLPKKPLIFFFSNITFTFLLSAAQFLFKPDPLVAGMNIVDLSFLGYLGTILFFAFIFPRKARTPRNVLKNLTFLFLFLMAFPLIFVSKTLEQLEKRLGVPLGNAYTTLDNFLLRTLNFFWKPLFGENFKSLSIHNFNSVLSINRIMLEIPWFGILLMSITAVLLLLIISVGDNPATQDIDGWLFTVLKKFITWATSFSNSPAILYALTAVSTIFVTEIFNNTTVLLVVTPAIVAMQPLFQSEQLLLLLLVTVAASGAFMSPVATPVNALAFGGLEKVSIKTLLRLGFFMNLIAAFLITTNFLILLYFL
ncbi:SLC13 family permease [Prosthecochloris sp.]|uniref:SLC13 family permease n=1 Tax=Prosthecochloris sp. TaxID=290513 RepID=UPI00257F9307|nr:SLC13 family permease [Prosthecochloris sp.]